MRCRGHALEEASGRALTGLISIAGTVTDAIGNDKKTANDYYEAARAVLAKK